MSETSVSEIIARYPVDRTSSLAILEDIQSEFKYLPRTALEEVSTSLEMNLSEVYQLATFYKAFSLTPKGDHIVKVCLGTACYVGGGPRILAALEKELNIQSGETTPDYRFSLEGVRCLGACALAPVMVIDDKVHGQMTPSTAAEVVASIRDES
jgi:NADH-quinone oxidoreductase subunit E